MSEIKVPESATGAIPGKQLVQHIHGEQPVAEYVEITKGQRDGIGWTIRAATVERVKELHEAVKVQFKDDLEAAAKKPEPKKP